MRNPRRKPQIDPVVDQWFTDVCAIAFITLFLMTIVLTLAAPKPIHAYSMVGGLLFGLAVGSFLYFCARLAIADSKKQHK